MLPTRIDTSDETDPGPSYVKATTARGAALCFLCRQGKSERVEHVTGTDENQDEVHATLQRIADALGTSPSTFIETAHERVFPDGGTELLHLWARIRDPATRRQALAVVRSLAEAEER